MDTSASLLERLQRSPDDDESWRRLDDIYRPLIARWLRADPTLGADIDDLTQEILAVVFRELPRFQRERVGSFREWLRTIAAYRVQGHYRSRRAREHGALTDLADDKSDLARRWDDEHNTHVLRRLLDLLHGEFNATQVQAFRRVFFDEAKPAAVASELGVSIDVVYLAKSRILKWLREVGKGLLD